MRHASSLLPLSAMKALHGDLMHQHVRVWLLHPVSCTSSKQQPLASEQCHRFLFFLSFLSFLVLVLVGFACAAAAFGS